MIYSLQTRSVDMKLQTRIPLGFHTSHAINATRVLTSTVEPIIQVQAKLFWLSGTFGDFSPKIVMTNNWLDCPDIPVSFQTILGLNKLVRLRKWLSIQSPIKWELSQSHALYICHFLCYSVDCDTARRHVGYVMCNQWTEFKDIMYRTVWEVVVNGYRYLTNNTLQS